MIVHTRGFFRVIAREEDVEEEEAVVVGCFAGAHDHGPKQMDPGFVDVDVNRIGEAFFQDLPLLHDDLVVGDEPFFGLVGVVEVVMIFCQWYDVQVFELEIVCIVFSIAW